MKKLKVAKADQKVTDCIIRATNAAAQDVDYHLNRTELVERVEAWRSATSTLAGKIASIIAGRTVDIEWSADIPLAATDGKNLILSARWFSDCVVPGIVSRNAASTAEHWGSLKSMLFHEISHIMWSPRFNQKPLKEIRDDGERWRVWNILEDQRIESLFTTKYSPSIPFFTKMVADHILTSGNREGRKLAWLWIHGRKYLPETMRNEYRRVFENYLADIGVLARVTADDFASIIDSYRVLVFPTDSEAGLALVNKFYDLLQIVFEASQMTEQTYNQEAHNWQNGHHMHNSGRTVPVAQSRKDRDEMVEDEAEAEPSAGSESTESSSGSSAESISGSSNSPLPSTDEMARTDDRALDETILASEYASDAVAEEGMEMVKSVARMAGDEEGSYIPNVANTYGAQYYPVDDWMPAASKRLVQEMARVFADYEDGWVRNNSSGRLNMVDAMSARGSHFDVFDVWQETDDADLSFEVAILVDRSSSMQGIDQWNTAKAMWVIQRACEQLEIPVTIIGYDNEASMMATKSNRARHNEFMVLPAQGGTYPVPALQWASSLMRNSHAKNRLIISLTDGQWSFDRGTSQPEYIVLDTLHRQGVQSLLVTIDSGWTIEPSRVGNRYYGHKQWVNLTRERMRTLPNEVGRQIAALANETLGAVA